MYVGAKLYSVIAQGYAYVDNIISNWSAFSGGYFAGPAKLQM